MVLEMDFDALSHPERTAETYIHGMACPSFLYFYIYIYIFERKVQRRIILHYFERRKKKGGVALEQDASSLLRY